MVCRLLWWYFHRRQYCWGSMVRVSAVKGSQIITCAAPFTVTKGNQISTKGVERCHTGCYDVVAAHSTHTHTHTLSCDVCCLFSFRAPLTARGVPILRERCFVFVSPPPVLSVFIQRANTDTLTQTNTERYHFDGSV